MSCTDCNLHTHCRNVLQWGRGSKPKRTKYLVIQDCITKMDDRFGQCLSGDGRDKFNWFMEKAGIKPEEVFFTSAIKCNPKETSDIKPKNIEACQKYLFNEILEHKPQVIIAMGKHAYNAVSGKTSIREFRGHFDDFALDYEVEAGGKTLEKRYSQKVMPTFSLNASLGKWEYNPDIIHDLKKAKKYVETGIIDKTEPCDLNVVLTKTGLNDMVEKYREVKFATTDFETTGFHFWKDKIINTGYYSGDGIADIVYLSPYKKEHLKKWNKEDIERAKQINAFLKAHGRRAHEALKQINSFKHLRLILHNGKFDAKFAAKNGMPYKNFWFDTLIADSLVDENLGHALNVAGERRNHNFGAYDTELWPYTNKDEKKKKSYQFVPPTLLEKYLGIDVYLDWLIFKDQLKELKDEGQWDYFFKQRMPALKKLLSMEYVGVKTDINHLKKISKVITRKQEKIQAKLVDITGNPDFNPNSHIQLNNYMVDAGYPFDKLQVKETKTGFSTAAAELTKFTKFKKWREFPLQVLNMKKITKIKGTYVDGKCIAEGTPIEIVRDTSKHPNGIPIEDVKVGDLAYCYDSNRELTIRPVTKTYKNGTKKVIKIHWQKYNSDKVGYLECTPNHEIRLLDGSYKKAEDLNIGQRVLFLSRFKKVNNRYNYLHFLHSRNKEKVEHRFILNHLGRNINNLHVHHKNHNPEDNRIENLDVICPKKHQSLHKKGLESPVALNLTKLETLRILFKAKGSPDNSSENFVILRKYLEKYNIDYKKVWLRFNREGEFLFSQNILNLNNRSKSNIYRYLNIAEKKGLKLIKEFNLNTNRNDKSLLDTISKSDVLSSLNKEIAPHFTLGIRKRDFERLCKKFDIEVDNHFITKIEFTNKEVETYDLEIEEVHNYIASEICVHNCGNGGFVKYIDDKSRIHTNFNLWTPRTGRYSSNSPSLQVWPRPIKGLPNTRQAIIPTNRDWCLFEADYSQLEQCVVAVLSGDKVLLKRIQGGMDLHCANAADLGRILQTVPQWVQYEHMLVANDKADLITDPKQVKELMRQIELDGKEINWKEKRTQAKNIGFGLNYGKEAFTFARDFKIPEDEAQDMVQAYFELYKGMKKWRDEQVEQALKKGYVTLLNGRKRRFHHAVEWINHEFAERSWSAKKTRQEISRQAMNAPVQGGAHDIFEPACLRVIKRFKKEKLKARLLLSIHDGLVGECPIVERQAVNQVLVEEMPWTFNAGTPQELTLKIDTDYYEWEWYGNKLKIS